MKKVSKYLSNSLLLISIIMILLVLFIDVPFTWMNIWLFLAPSLVIQEYTQLPPKGKRRVYSFVYISVASVMFGIATLSLFIDG
ncbi:hypothetical protein [Halobacillus salinus]|uniref:Uncharacterized protein n=1 Tax=Halobacillus salinus TaxID=192814 RepID=A0A4Z0GZA8_9BACI|nr:hypothetical protein [Halobacillus salinus]TGB03562.1 hypothetical protein E4663_00730 [Halobacillus salinus]